MRALDHLVLPVTDIRTARERLAALGFTVAADGRHPFGTENCCLYFSDKTFLEPLGVGSDSDYAAAIRAGNQFVARDAIFRARRGQEGLSALVLAADDAAADHEAFVAAGLSGGDMLDFSRPMIFPDGTQQTASFRLAFATGHNTPGFFAFSCQRINQPTADRAALEAHANGATGVRRVVLTAQDPSAHRALLSMIADGEIVDIDGGLSANLRNHRVELMTPEAFSVTFGREPLAGGDLSGQLIQFSVRDIKAMETLLQANGVAAYRKDDLLIAPPQAGQGAPFTFSEV